MPREKVRCEKCNEELSYREWTLLRNRRFACERNEDDKKQEYLNRHGTDKP